MSWPSPPQRSQAIPIAPLHSGHCSVRRHHKQGESHRVYRRALSERGWSRWGRPSKYSPEQNSVPSGWSPTTPPSIRHNGRPYSGQSARNSGFARNRCAAGCDRRSRSAERSDGYVSSISIARPMESSRYLRRRRSLRQRIFSARRSRTSSADNWDKSGDCVAVSVVECAPQMSPARGRRKHGRTENHG